VYVYLFILWNFQRSHIWTWAYDWDVSDVKCEYQPLPVNQSGLKVLFAAFAKTGTWAVTKELHRVYPRTYHSEEFLVHVWAHIAAEYWARPENGARKPPINHILLSGYYADQEYRRTGIRPTPDIELKPGEQQVRLPIQRFPNDDIKVLSSMTHETLAAYVSRCRVDSIALDGVTDMFWPLLEVSPGVKVVSLDWRPYESFLNSSISFALKWISLTFATNLVYSSLHGLPWGVFVRGLDPLFGSPIGRMLRTGGAFLQNDYHVPSQLWSALTFQRRVFSHWWGGLAYLPSKEQYEGFYREVKMRVPKEDLLSFDLRKDTWETLCAFLSIKECPRSGVMEHVTNVNSWEKPPWGEVPEPMMLAPIFLFCHWVNWRVFRFLVAQAFFLLFLPCRLAGGLCCRAKAD